MALVGIDLAGLMPTFIMWAKLLLIIPIAIVMIFVALIAWKNNKFVYPVLVIRDFGLGKIGVYMTKAGKFKKVKALFGLLDISGEMEMLTKRGSIISNYSDNDMHDIGGKKGFIVFQKPDDARILAPISRTQLQNTELVMAIANADYRDIAVTLKKKSEHEMMGTLDRIMPYISIAIVGIIVFMIAVVVIQMITTTTSNVITMAKEAITQCGGVASTIASTTAP